jgi:tetratricopeptide (TPR) repeat protein
MSDQHANSKPPSVTPHEEAAGAPAPATEKAPSALQAGWRDVWQLPTFLLATGAVVGGLIYVSRQPREHDFAGALDQVETLLTEGHLDEARAILFDSLAARLEEGSVGDRARFDAISADWLSAARIGTAAVENDQQIADRYARAEENGFELSRDQMMRWAVALVHLGRTEEAMERIGETSTDTPDEHALRARVRRLVIERAWNELVSGKATSAPATTGEGTKDAHGEEHASAEGHGDEASHQGHGEHASAAPATREARYEAMLVALGTYRSDPSLSLEDESWAIARQAEARMALGRQREAADRLLIDLRRLESAPTDVRGIVPRDSFGELFSLLGRAYADIGEVELARDNLERAVAIGEGKTIAKGEALVKLGELSLLRGELDDAEHRFESVLNDYEGESASTLALLGRAETRAARADHAMALADYRELRKRLRAETGAGKTPRVQVTDAVGSLVDRHDALVVAGEYEQALEYARLAAEFVPGRPLSHDLVLRLGTTASSLASKLESGPDAHDPEVSPKISRLYRQAGEWYLAHSRHADANRESPRAWSDSLWMAGDCFERSGWHEDAIRAFTSFVDGSPTDEARRPEAIGRIAAMLHAENRLDEAAAAYTRLAEEFAGSPQAAQAAVPLARCLDALGLRAEAISRLQPIVDGVAGLRPESNEYREALLELARLVIADGDLDRGATLLGEALRRYPDDHRAAFTRFQLGECKRGQARRAATQLADGALSPSQREEIDERRRADLDAARGEFDFVVSALETRREKDLDPLDRDVLRLAHLYRADCLFDLGRYQDAIDHYEVAERRYSDSAVSMIALIQIVNCWHELGDEERAATAQRRAEIRLGQLPDSAFMNADSIFQRGAWERWLRNAPPGPNEGSVASAPRGGSDREAPE